MFCQECPKKPFCSNLCPEALAYADQNQRPRREFFTISEAKWGRIADGGDSGEAHPLSRTEWKIVTLLKRGLSRKETCEVLDISRQSLRSHLSRIRAKCDSLPLFPDWG